MAETSWKRKEKKRNLNDLCRVSHGIAFWLLGATVIQPPLLFYSKGCIHHVSYVICDCYYVNYVFHAVFRFEGVVAERCGASVELFRPSSEEGERFNFTFPYLVISQTITSSFLMLIVLELVRTNYYECFSVARAAPSSVRRE